MTKQPVMLLSEGARALLIKLEEGFRLVPGTDWKRWTIRKDGLLYSVRSRWVQELIEGRHIRWNYPVLKDVDVVLVNPPVKAEP